MADAEATKIADDLREILTYSALDSADVSHASLQAEMNGKAYLTNVMTDLDKHGQALTFVSAYGVVKNLGYGGLLVDEEHLQERDYLEIEATERDLARATLDLMECLLPNAEDAINPPTASGLGEQGEALWKTTVAPIHASVCEIDFYVLMRRFVDADFENTEPTERQALVDEIISDHSQYLDAGNISDKCEEFT
ncbi:hypothetical protein [Yoonia sp. I 8.24]|uniref:hypothetical protein n=1 Tax=Yoonia sp. I 8.24 TaxID=1537229 RepID=UPI001EDD5E7A|nr:hypothetical protein [Yoonia sp. I 8.24]MCG3266494.1 hypothetical protein [Yoonia sp. I 8.24]